MSTKNKIRTEIIHRHGIESDWVKAVNFIPSTAELIVYDMYDGDGNKVYDRVRYKIGDGIHTVTDLPFLSVLTTGLGANSIKQSGCEAVGVNSVATGDHSRSGITGYFVQQVQLDPETSTAYVLIDDTTLSDENRVAAKYVQALQGTGRTPLLHILVPSSMIPGAASPLYYSNDLVVANIVDASALIPGAAGVVLVCKMIGEFRDRSIKLENSDITQVGYCWATAVTSNNGVLDFTNALLLEGGQAIPQAGAGHAEGYYTRVHGLGGHAEGIRAEAHAPGGHAEGWDTRVSSAAGHAEGRLTTVEGVAGHAEGFGTDADGNESHAEGLNGKAIGEASHVEGKNGEANGNWSHVEGDECYTSPTALSGHAEGSYSKVYAAQGHAEGLSTVVMEDAYNSHTEGEGTVASRRAQHVEGRFNLPDTGSRDVGGITYGDYIHIVGNGVADKLRSNAHTLDWNGNAWFAGDVVADDVSLQELNSKIGDISSALDSIIAIQEGLIGNTIIFYIEDIPLAATAGMTWEVWADSQKNRINAYINQEPYEYEGDIYIDFAADSAGDPIALNGKIQGCAVPIIAGATYNVL